MWHKERESELMGIKLARKSVESEKKRGQIDEHDYQLVLDFEHRSFQALSPGRGA